MPRMRTLKPEFFSSLTMAQCERSARLLFAAIWCYADDEGRADDDARLARSWAFPLDDVTVAQVEDWLRQLAECGAIVRYTVDGRSYLVIPSFKDHQRPQRSIPSRRPPPPPKEDAQRTHGALMDHSMSAHGGLMEDSQSAITNPVCPENSTVIRSVVVVEGSGGESSGGESSGGGELLSHVASKATHTAREAHVPQVQAAPASYRIAAIIAVNQSLNRKYGESTRPIMANAGTTAECVERWWALGIPEAWLCETLADMAFTMPPDTRPKSLRYFLEAVVDRWQARDGKPDALDDMLAEAKARAVAA